MKKNICMMLIITMILCITGCGGKEKTDTMSVILQVDTGDSVKMTIDKSDGHSINFNKDTSIIDINDADGNAVIMGEFVPQASYAFLYEKVYTDAGCEITDTGNENGAAYTFGVYNNGTDSVCEYIAWIVGTNTGIVFESSSVAIDDFTNILKKVAFSVEKTNQVNENYAYEPNIDSAGNDGGESDMASGRASESDVPTPATETDTQETDSEQKKEDEGESTKPVASADWTSLLIKIDGVEYSFPYSYNLLKTNGWDFNIQDYLEEGQTEFLLEEGEYTYSTTKLKNPSYGDKLGTAEIYIGFKNYDTETKNIIDCDLWALEVVAVYGSQLIENHPEIELPGGIRFGATYDEIIAAYGEPTEINDESEYYIQLDYDHDYNQHMTLYVYKGEHDGEATGLLDVELRGYN